MIGDVIIPAGQTSIPDSAYYKNLEMTSLHSCIRGEIGNNVIDHCFKLVYITVDAENPHFQVCRVVLSIQKMVRH